MNRDHRGLARDVAAQDPNPFVIVGGTYRSGTTAIYTYLASHPAVCGSEIKEAGYFLPPGHPVTAQYRIGRDPLSRYLDLFDTRRKPNAVRVEATPSYLFEKASAQAIHATLPQSKLIFTLREPTAWLASWHQTLRLMNRLPADSTPDSYVESMIREHRPLDERPFYLRALEHGRYSDFLPVWLDLFGKNRVMVIWFDDLERSPRQTMQRIAKFAGLDPAYYNDYAFRVINQAKQLKWPALHRAYRGLMRRFERVTAIDPRVHDYFLRKRRGLDRRFYATITAPAAKEAFTPATRDRLIAYYSDEADRLTQLLGESVPWGNG